MTIKSALKENRLRVGLSQSEIAKKLGISQTGYQRRETGLVQVKLVELDKLSKIFGVSIADLVSTKQPEKRDKEMDWEVESYKLQGKFEYLQEIVSNIELLQSLKGPACLTQRADRNLGNRSAHQKSAG